MNSFTQVAQAPNNTFHAYLAYAFWASDPNTDYYIANAEENTVRYIVGRVYQNNSAMVTQFINELFLGGAYSTQTDQSLFVIYHSQAS